MAILKRSSCANLDRLVERGFKLPAYDELASELEGVQGLRKIFFRRFWMTSGREVVHVIATGQLEAVSVFVLL